jgi:regulator of protease activity HflC (stomatin/prohibitin superfamily)
MNKTWIFIIALLAAILVLWSACAPGPNDAEKTAGRDGKIAGFWSGLWHGLISPVTFIISIFTKNVRFYEIHNNGTWYNLGFVIGAGLFLSGGILGRKKSKNR